MSTSTSPSEGRYSTVELDPSLYDPSPEQVVFFKQQTGIESDEELKEHVLKVQREAWEVVHYVCIRTFGFTKLKISQHPIYPELLKLGHERPDAIYLEFACCFGNDARKAIADGYPIRNVICADIEKPFWDLGHKLFKTTPETFPVPFVPGNIFDPTYIAPHEPFYETPSTTPPTLSSLTALTPLEGHVSAIHASAFFHLFTREEQIAAARALAALLSPQPGTVIFGSHSSQSFTGPRGYKNLRGKEIHCYSPEDWKGFWNGEVFKEGTVTVDAQLIQVDTGTKDASRESSGRLIWSVKRL